MDQDRKARLEAGGINIHGALERFMGNEAMLERYLQKFLTEKSYAGLEAAIAAAVSYTHLTLPTTPYV